MKMKFIQKISMVALLTFGVTVSSLMAQTPQLRTTSSRVRTLLTRMNLHAANLKNEIDRSRYDDSAMNADERVSDNVSALSDAAQDLRKSTYGYRGTDDTANVTTILDRASLINSILARNATSSRVNSRWATLKADVNNLASYYGVAANWDKTIWNDNNNNTGNQTPQLRTSGAQVRSILALMRNQSLNLKREMDRDRYDDTTNNADDRVSTNLEAMTSAIDRLSRSSYSYGSADDAVQVNAILDRASRINALLSRNATSSRVNGSWNILRGNVDTLAGYYGVAANWTNNNNNDGSYRNLNLTGTYRLNTADSENVATEIDRSVGYYSNDQRDNVRRNLERRLASPSMIAINKNGRTITLASSNQPQVTFDADGIGRTETNNRGRSITTRVTTSGNDFTVDTSGDRVNDFNVKFDIDENGRLKVTRRLYLENRNETITVSSVYDRISPTADWASVPLLDTPYNPGNGSTTTGTFYVPNGMTLTATLRNTVSTKVSQAGDKFTMDVISPNAYRGAVIEGRVVEAGSSGRISGRANVQLDFDTITMNGRTYQFAGLIQSVSSANGDTVSVNNEGTIRDSNQTTKTATRAGIGAILGAIIGAVVDGGSGAAIGAGVGAGAGAGTVLIGGKDSIELGTGSNFTILSSAPANAVYNTRN